jgi:hypothetical protein
VARHRPRHSGRRTRSPTGSRTRPPEARGAA